VFKPWMSMTMTLVGVFALSFSWGISDTTLSVHWMTDAYAAEQSELLDLNTAAPGLTSPIISLLAGTPSKS